MKYPILIFLGLMLVFSACKKGDTENTTAPADSAYFFKFNFAGSDYHLKSVLPDNVPCYPSEIRGVQVHGDSDVPLIILTIAWPANHQVTDGDLADLEGKSFPLGGSSRISFLKENNGTVWNTVSSQVHISEVKFIKTQTITGELVLVHSIKGTCSATMSDGTNTTSLANGSFNLAVGVLAR